jgi:hypothetical protein
LKEHPDKGGDPEKVRNCDLIISSLKRSQWLTSVFPIPRRETFTTSTVKRDYERVHRLVALETFSICSVWEADAKEAKKRDKSNLLDK